MFCDDAYRLILEAGFSKVQNLPDDPYCLPTRDVTDLIRSVFGEAERVFLDPSAVRAIDNLADPKLVEKQREHIVLPSHTTWLEWSGDAHGFPTGIRRHGLLFYAVDRHMHMNVELDGSKVYSVPKWTPEIEAARLATVMYFQEYTIPGKPIRMSGMSFDTHGTGTLLRRQQQAIARALVTGKDVEGAEWSLFDFPKASAWLGACLILLATPRVYRKEPADLVKMNKKRTGMKKMPFLQYNTVFIDIGKEYVVHPRPRDQSEEPAAKGLASRRKQHDVRPFLRLKKGQVEVVRPHKRGDPSLGIIKHNFRVRA